MGERTLLSFPKSKPLKNRVNLVLCPEGHEYDGCICLHTFEDMVNHIKLFGAVKDVYIIGGAMFYSSTIDLMDKVFVTKVDADGEAEVFFPNLDERSDFQITDKSENFEENDLIYRFVTYEKIK